ncbi:putative Alpha/beta hydrolase fold protein [metagenome]|uniref:Putative Alpha/beta hydrolase fold protein n=1 Tax=metagenome TaxID=256318 RepID=A0A2P2CB68_9ZZZZ
MLGASRVSKGVTMRRPGVVLVAVLLVLSSLSLSSGATASRPASCPDVDGPKCSAQLRTGIEMAYVEVGPSNGPAVILLHGLTDSSRSWSLAMAELHALRPDLHLYALDQRGQGGSSMPTAPICRSAPERCFEMKDLARDVVAFMRTERLRSATLVGHSMGSFVAQEVALRHPRRVDNVVLVASSTTGAGNPTLADYVLTQLEGPWRESLEAQGYSWPQDAYSLTPLDADADAVEWMKTFWDADPVAPLSLVEAIATETASVRLGTWLGETKALLATDNARRLRHLKAPALVLWGVQDPIFYASPDQDSLIEALTRAAKGKGSFAFKEYGAIPLPASGYQESDIGHNIQWEAPAQVALDIDAFLRTGLPTADLYRSDFPVDVQHIVTEPGAARVISRR